MKPGSSKREKRGRRATPPGRPVEPRTKPGRYWALAVGLSAVVCYLNAFGQEFVFDDIRLIRDNLRIRSLANVPHLFATSYWDLEGSQGLYRPLVLVSYAVNYAMHGLATVGYTAVNIGLHAAVSVLLFALVRTLGGSLRAAGGAGLAFAIHPVHTEAVTGLSGRPELLAAVFFLLAMILHRRAPSAGRTATAYRTGVLLSFLCALLSKESAMTLALVLPAMDALLPAKGIDGHEVGPRARVLKDYVPLAVVALGYLALRRAVLGGVVIARGAIAPLDNPLVPLTTAPFGERMGATAGQAMMTAFAVVVEYARMIAWPVRLSPDYSFNQIPLVTSALDARFAGGVALVVACIAGVFALRRRSPVAAFGLAFLALTFSIVSNIVVTIGTICAERLFYLPSAGILIAAAVGVDRLVELAPARRRLVIGAIVVLLAAGAARTWIRNGDWRNEATLWSAAAATAPGSARVQSEYGRILLGQAEEVARAGRRSDADRLYASARSHFEAALAIYPSYSPPIDGLAMIHSLNDRFDEAIVMYERALTAWPGNYAALTNWASAVWERSRRAGVEAARLHAQGRTADAASLLREADSGARQALGMIDKAIAMMPSYAQAHLVRAMILEVYASDRAGAIAEFEAVLRLMPNHPQRDLVESELQRLRAHAPSGRGGSGAPYGTDRR